MNVDFVSYCRLGMTARIDVCNLSFCNWENQRCPSDRFVSLSSSVRRSICFFKINVDVTVSSNSSQPPLEYHSLLGSAQTVGSFLVPPTRKGSSNLFIKVSLISSAVTIRLKTDSFTNRASRKATIFVGLQPRSAESVRKFKLWSTSPYFFPSM